MDDLVVEYFPRYYCRRCELSVFDDLTKFIEKHKDSCKQMQLSRGDR